MTDSANAAGATSLDADCWASRVPASRFQDEAGYDQGSDSKTQQRACLVESTNLRIVEGQYTNPRRGPKSVVTSTTYAQPL